MADHLVEQQDDRRAVGFGQVEGLHGYGKDVLVVRGRQGDDRMVAVRAPAGLVNVALAHVGGNAGGRSAALHVGDHAGDLGHDGVPQSLLHQRKPRAARGRHGLAAGQRGADDGAQRGDLVLHLDELAADLRQAVGQEFGDFGRGGDRVARKKIEPRVQGSLHAGFVALNEFYGVPHGSFTPGFPLQ